MGGDQTIDGIFFHAKEEGLFFLDQILGTHVEIRRGLPFFEKGLM